MITASGLTFTVRPGTVTGFLGPNVAGKSTTMRMILGLDSPTRGHATIGDRPYADHRAPLQEVGALLEAGSVHPGRTAHHHLLALALTHGIPRGRVEHVLDLTGLTDVAGRRVKGFSLGMGQRLGIAAALLGDPATLILDEPVNGLDPSTTGPPDPTPQRAEMAPQPSLTDLDHLMDGVRSAGLPVSTTIHGQPNPLPPGRQLTVYRVIQEALTNTLKHGGPDATSTVTLSYGNEGALTVTVTDTGHGSRSRPNGGRGRGLTGMRERTALYGGTLEAGPLPEQGWRVHLHLPEEPPQ